MKKCLFFCGILISAMVVNARNWSGVVISRISMYNQITTHIGDQTGFISIDSSAMVGINMEYYFCKTLRIDSPYNCPTIHGASWMG
jgi:GTP-dependent phosphoenolpyruvate carboxykinase